MIWVCRPGKEGKYFPLFYKNSRIYLAWEGYNADLSSFKTRDEFRNIVKAEKKTNANQSRKI